MLACKLCGEVRTTERTYTTMTGVTYILRYFVCKHSPSDTARAQPLPTAPSPR